VSAVRPDESLLGNFRIIISDRFGLNEQFSITVREDGKVDTTGNPVDELSKSLTALRVPLYFLPDDRRVQSTSLIENNDRVSVVRRGVRSDLRPTVWGEPGQVSEDEPAHHLQIGPVLSRLHTWLSRKMLTGSTLGDENAVTIYLRVAEQLSHLEGGLGDSRSSETFVSRIRKLEIRTEEFARFGLAATFPSEKFVPIFQTSHLQAQKAIADVLEPYLRGIEARLDALEDVRSIVAVYQETLNAFFRNKRAHFTVRSGLAFTSQFGDPLNPYSLSSGEKQLLLLLSNTILARETSGIFLIDEPELSLNVKWQRELVSTLLKCAQGSNIQYILASHSIELITQHKQNSVRLRNR
jgi:hypothetical protein